MTSARSRAYDDIPGTYIMDGQHSRAGYALNMFCMTLNEAANRDAFAADEQTYLQRFQLTPEQQQAVLARDYLRLLQLGGNIYYVFKLAIFDGHSMQYVGAQMSGVSEADFKAMMVAGGRPIDGNRYRQSNTEEG